MRYSDSQPLNDVYVLVENLFETEFRDSTSADRAMTIAAALAELGEDRSWASVWWAYGAIHHDLTDGALERASALLLRVVVPASAQAAALMLRAEIRASQAANVGLSPDVSEQVALLTEASQLEPRWPSIQVRLARALHDANRIELARRHAAAAAALTDSAPSTEPFDTAFTGRGLTPGWAADEMAALGLLP